MNYLTIIILLVVLFVIYNMHKTEGFITLASNPLPLRVCPEGSKSDENWNCTKTTSECPKGSYYSNVDNNCYVDILNRICPEDQKLDLERSACVQKIDVGDFVCPEGYGIARNETDQPYCKLLSSRCPANYVIATHAKGTRCCPTQKPKLTLYNSSNFYCKD
jgi:hypothetical protein